MSHFEDRGGDKGSVAGDRDSRASTPTLPESGSSARDKRKATGVYHFTTSLLSHFFIAWCFAGEHDAGSGIV